MADDTFNSPNFSAFIPHIEVDNQNWDEITKESGKDCEETKLPIDSTRALVQYLETSGFKSLIGKSWIEVWQQLQNQSVDLLLICLQDKLPLGLDQALSNLEQIAAKPPILVLENSHHQLPENLTGKNLNLVLSKIATKILPSDLSIADLLEEIKHHVMSNID